MYFVKIGQETSGKGVPLTDLFHEINFTNGKSAHRGMKNFLFRRSFQCCQHFRVVIKTVESCTKVNALKPTFNFLLKKFTLNSLLEKNSVFQNHFIGNKASEIDKNFFSYFLVEIMFSFLLRLLIENFKPEDYCFEII